MDKYTGLATKSRVDRRVSTMNLKSWLSIKDPGIIRNGCRVLYLSYGMSLGRIVITRG